MFNFLLQRWKLSSREGSLLVQMLLLAVTILAYSVVAMAIANSLFVSSIGANSLPIAFICIGLASIPAYGIFSTAIDRYRRPTLFRFVLLVSIAIALSLRGLLTLDTPIVYYALLIAVFFQWDFYNNILYPSLVIDYFTSVEYKRYAPFIGIAQAAGTLLGGGLTILLSHYLPTQDLLWSLPCFCAIAFGQILYLEKSQPRVDLVNSSEKISLIASLKSFPNLAQEYPLVFLLAGSSFLLVIIYLSSEFLWFNIYGNSFTESQLTSFLGLMRILISLVQVAILYGITRPLLQKFGVAKLNGVYPVTTLFSFAGLLLSFQLPSAIGLQLNGDAFYKAINLPIHQLNYNAIPTEFRGRVRTLSDGLIYALGLTVAGIFLWISHHYLSLGQITWLATGLTVLLLGIRLPMGKYYSEGLAKIIKADLIDLDELVTEKIELTPQLQTTIQAMLTNKEDRYLQLKGLELLGFWHKLSDFLPEITEILIDADEEARDTIVKLLATATDTEAKKLIEELLAEKPAIAQITAWELAINKGLVLKELKQQLLLKNRQNLPFTSQATSTEHQVTASLVQYCDLTTLVKEIEPQHLTEAEQISLIRAVSYSKNEQAVALLSKILQQASARVQYQTLKALTNFANPENETLAQIAVQYLTNLKAKNQRDTDELITLSKINAWKIIELTRCTSILPSLQWDIVDSDTRLQQQIANSLAAFGELVLPLAQKNLTSEHDSVRQIAIAILGKIGTKQTTDIIYDYLTPDFNQLKQTKQWQNEIVDRELLWKPLLIAIADYQQRVIQKVLDILSYLESYRTINAIKQILITKDEKALANAVEVLASIKHRRFVVPLIPILEQQLKSSVTNPQNNSQWLEQKGYKILADALKSQDNWLKQSALTVLANLPQRNLISQDLAAVVQPCQQNVMNRLLLLKQVPLLKYLSLDELLAIEKALIPEQVLAEQTIYTEGSWGAYFYIIAEGTVKLKKQVNGQAQEIKQVSLGEYFGEIALFDDAPRWDTAIAVTNCVLLKLEKKQFLNLVAQRPHIILEVCRFLSQRLRETDKYLSLKQ